MFAVGWRRSEAPFIIIVISTHNLISGFLQQHARAVDLKHSTCKRPPPSCLQQWCPWTSPTSLAPPAPPPSAYSYVPNTVQRRLAEEVTRFVHGEEGLQQALKATEVGRQAGQGGAGQAGQAGSLSDDGRPSDALLQHTPQGGGGCSAVELILEYYILYWMCRPLPPPLQKRSGLLMKRL